LELPQSKSARIPKKGFIRKTPKRITPKKYFSYELAAQTIIIPGKKAKKFTVEKIISLIFLDV
jgi:hypothetical protein